MTDASLMFDRPSPSDASRAARLPSLALCRLVEGLAQSDGYQATVIPDLTLRGSKRVTRSSEGFGQQPGQVHMRASNFRQHFRVVTGTSPLHHQKQLRLPVQAGVPPPVQRSTIAGCPAHQIVCPPLDPVTTGPWAGKCKRRPEAPSIIEPSKSVLVGDSGIEPLTPAV